MKTYYSHYDWLDENLKSFFDKLNVRYSDGIIVAHGDKCYSYKSDWKDAGIPFHHGVAVFLLTYEHPHCTEVGMTENGWVPHCKWVIDNYPRFKQFLNP